MEGIEIEQNGNNMTLKQKGINIQEEEIEFLEDTEGVSSCVRCAFLPFCSRKLTKDQYCEALNSYKAFLLYGKNGGVYALLKTLSQSSSMEFGGFEPLSGLELNVLAIKCKSMPKPKPLKMQFWSLSDSEQYLSIRRPYLQGSNLLVVDGFCTRSMKRYILDNTFLLEPGCNIVVISRLDENGKIIDEDLIKEFDKLSSVNVIDGRNYEALSCKARELYKRMIDKANPKFEVEEVKYDPGFKYSLEFEEENGFRKNKLGKLFDKVRNNKGKTACFLSLITLEELWRNGFFGGKKLMKEQKKIKEAVKPKDAQTYSAATEK